jgi:hypothetical protein
MVYNEEFEEWWIAQTRKLALRARKTTDGVSISDPRSVESEVIANEAKEIRRKIEGGAIFGEAIKGTADDDILVAAYYCGLTQAGSP